MPDYNFTVANYLHVSFKFSNFTHGLLYVLCVLRNNILDDKDQYINPFLFPTKKNSLEFHRVFS